MINDINIDIISEDVDFNCAYRGEKCLNHPSIEATGVLYYWCGNSDCCAPPPYYLCEKCLIEQYKERM